MLGITFSFLQDIKNDVSNSYFVKIKTSSLSTCKIIVKQEKDVYLGCNMKQTLFWGSLKSSRPVQWAGYISQHLKQKIHLSIRGLFQKRQAGWLRKCFFKYSTEVTVVLEIQENSKVIANELP